MSDLQASVEETLNGFHVTGYEKIEHDFAFIDNVFDKQQPDVAKCYDRWGRCLTVMDQNMFGLYGQQIQEYFAHYNVDLTIHKMAVGEKAKSLDTLLKIVDSMTEFGIMRKVRIRIDKQATQSGADCFRVGTSAGSWWWACY